MILVVDAMRLRRSASRSKRTAPVSASITIALRAEIPGSGSAGCSTGAREPPRSVRIVSRSRIFFIFHHRNQFARPGTESCCEILTIFSLVFFRLRFFLGLAAVQEVGQLVQQIGRLLHDQIHGGAGGLRHGQHPDAFAPDHQEGHRIHADAGAQAAAEGILLGRQRALGGEFRATTAHADVDLGHGNDGDAVAHADGLADTTFSV